MHEIHQIKPVVTGGGVQGKLKQKVSSTCVNREMGVYCLDPTFKSGIHYFDHLIIVLVHRQIRKTKHTENSNI